MMNWMHELRRLLQRATGTPPAPQPPGGIPCHEAAEHVFEWLDGELNPELHGSVGVHLETCGRCFPMLRFERAFLEVLARVSETPQPSADFEERVLGALRGEGLTGS